jgi:hypothetical protein
MENKLQAAEEELLEGDGGSRGSLAVMRPATQTFTGITLSNRLVAR